MQPKSTREFVDQMGRTINIQWPPQRIVSLVPSLSELLWDLGMENQLVGITKFCIHPEQMYRSLPRVGGTKSVHYDKIAELKPDLIVANKEENTREMVGELEKHYPVWVSDVNDFSGALDMISQLGEVVNKRKPAETLVKKLREKHHAYRAKTEGKDFVRPRVVYLIWREPWMAVGPDTFIDEMLKLAGCENSFERKNRYPETSLKEIAELNPDYLFLSSEPYPFGDKHIEELSPILPRERILLVDGELFSWYGSRLLQSFNYFNNLRNQLPF